MTGRQIPADAPLTGTVVEVLVGVGDAVRAGRPVVILESMKMEHEVPAPVTGRVTTVAVATGDTVANGDRLMVIDEVDVEEADRIDEEVLDPTTVRSDLAEVLDRQARTSDEARPEAVAKRYSYGHRTARENIADLCDPGSFVEYGALAVAAQRDRRSLDDLIANTPADG